jgi:hypothetical protein
VQRSSRTHSVDFWGRRRWWWRRSRRLRSWHGCCGRRRGGCRCWRWRCLWSARSCSRLCRRSFRWGAGWLLGLFLTAAGKQQACQRERECKFPDGCGCHSAITVPHDSADCTLKSESFGQFCRIFGSLPAMPQFFNCLEHRFVKPWIGWSITLGNSSVGTRSWIIFVGLDRVARPCVQSICV